MNSNKYEENVTYFENIRVKQGTKEVILVAFQTGVQSDLTTWTQAARGELCGVYSELVSISIVLNKGTFCLYLDRFNDKYIIEISYYQLGRWSFFKHVSLICSLRIICLNGKFIRMYLPRLQNSVSNMVIFQVLKYRFIHNIFNSTVMKRPPSNVKWSYLRSCHMTCHD